MVFTTRASASTANSAPGARYRRLWLAALLSLVSTSALAEGFFITGIHTRLQDNVYRLDANIDYRLSDDALDALNNGVPLTFQVEIEIQRKRRWWLDAVVATLQQRYQLRFHALSHQYQVHNINSGAFYSFHTLEGALENLGDLNDFPLLDRQLVEEGEAYEVLLHVELDIEALPSPLRPLAYITPAWRLNSDWYTWSLIP
ncbi:MAG: DUF4390 domain-containing protein [Gammaproteobacteria bacterium]|nr:DUF4390 domain-containing protein [Gammaproteobacteria bacterium]MCW8839816.1 DUF4390 domain-containing protein [Gammaproteobacteria bacterium]MCW8972138.1 DUF4390 domain-containing protein [Gammaproteobacteria bacterium]MCW8992301.1 DUF4390 domain-containing protein [Gammaproteobacteria bacterium]MCW9089273.1 DUF4390 domain-containing protein [Gammaproteobacteria bacterium]